MEIISKKILVLVVSRRHRFRLFLVINNFFAFSLLHLSNILFSTSIPVFRIAIVAVGSAARHIEIHLCDWAHWADTTQRPFRIKEPRSIKQIRGTVRLICATTKTKTRTWWRNREEKKNHMDQDKASAENQWPYCNSKNSSPSNTYKRSRTALDSRFRWWDICFSQFALYI